MSDQNTVLETIIMAVAREVFPKLLADDKAETERRVKAELKVAELQAALDTAKAKSDAQQAELDELNALAGTVDAFLTSKA